MAVQIISDGIPVTLDTRLWSLDATMRPVAPTAYVGGDLVDPVYVYRTQRSVRLVTEFLARNIAQVALHAYTLDDNGDRERLPANRPLPRLLKAPSPTSTAYEFARLLVLDVCLFDRFAAAISGSGPTLELVRLPPETWKFERDGLRRPTGIVRRDQNGEYTTLALSSALWLDGYPTNCETSPMEALCELLTEERESQRYRRQLWEKGARMPGYIRRPADAPPWATPHAPGGKSARDKFREQWRAFRSDGDRAGEEPLLEDGMEYHQLQALTPESAQQLETRKFSIAEVSAYFHLPPVFAGLLDNANYSNVDAYREILYSDTLGPWFQQIGQAYNARLLLHPEVVGMEGEFVEHNVAEKLRMSFDEQAKIFQTAVGGPVMTRAEARKRLNLPHLDGTDELIVPLNVLAGGQASPTDSDPTAVPAGGRGASDGAAGGEGSATKAGRSLSAAEVVQKVYLGVGKVITVPEARQIINDAGATLDVDAPVAAPAPDPQNEGGQ